MTDKEEWVTIDSDDSGDFRMTISEKHLKRLHQEITEQLGRMRTDKNYILYAFRSGRVLCSTASNPRKGNVIDRREFHKILAQGVKT